MMHISIDTSEPLSDTEKALLKALIGETVVAKADTADAAPAPRKRAAAKPKPAPAPEPDEDDDDDDEDVNTEEANDRPAPKKRAAAKPKAGGLREKVTETVTDLVASGQAKKVKAALADLGVAKASELDEDQLQDFLDSLED